MPGVSLLRGSASSGATIARPTRRDEPGPGPHLAPIRQRIESIFLDLKGSAPLERHGARTLAGLREPLAGGLRGLKRVESII